MANSQDPRSPTQRRRLVRAAVLTGGLMTVYAALGFLAAPPLLRHLIVTKGSAALHRDVQVAKVRVNPFSLSVRIDGLAVKHRDGEPFLAWDSLYLRAAPLRLLAGDVGIAEVRLVRPAVHAGIDAGGTLSFQDLLAPGDPVAPAPREEKRSWLGLYVGRLAVDEARVSFRDATRHPRFDTSLGPLTVRLETLRSKGGGDSPYSFTGTTESGETFRWTGTVRAQPLGSVGTLAFERIKLSKYAPYIHDQVPLQLRDGLLDLETRYEFEWSAARRLFRTSEGKVTVTRLAVGPPDAEDSPVRLPRIEVSGVAVDALEHQAKVAAVEVSGGAVRIRREADGRLELARLAPPPAPTPAPSKWTWSVGSFSVSELALNLEDRVPARPVALPLTGVQLRVSGLRPGTDVSWPVDLSLIWNGQGRLALTGPIQPYAMKGALDLDAADLDLLPLDPYLDAATTARLTGGRASTRMKLGFDASGSALRWTLTGNLRLDEVSLAEKNNDALLAWRALEVTGIDATAIPTRVSVKLVRLVEPRVKAYVWEDGTTSVARARASAPATAAAPPPASGPGWRTAIGAVQIVHGRLAFVDRTVRPPAVLNLSGAEAKVTSLSSDPTVRSAVDVRVDVEGVSPVRITGTLNPLQKDAYTKLVVASQGVDLSPLDPYSGKFLGYGIEKGKLSLDLRYEIENRKLAATNVVKVDQFTLGQSTDSPDATKIPVRLALALLQDRDGVILLDVPVEGSLDDPDFHLGRVIWRTILNVLVKVATSPFRALAALAGSSKTDLSVAEFAPGLADPLPAAQESFTLLAKSLAQRPAVALELEGASDEARDGPPLRRAELERSLRRAKAATLRSPPASADDLPLPPEERVRLVRHAYDTAFPTQAERKPNEMAPSPPTPQQMEDRLVAAVQVPPEAFRALAGERARRARQALIDAGIDQGRLFLIERGGGAPTATGACVYFTVR